jgi:hypothetical protein
MNAFRRVGQPPALLTEQAVARANVIPLRGKGDPDCHGADILVTSAAARLTTRVAVGARSRHRG